MPSEVASTINSTLSKGQHRTVFRNPRGNKRHYYFYLDLPNLTYEWSSNGTTWSNTPVTITTDAPDSFDVKIRDDGSQLVVWYVWHIGNMTKYIRGTISDASNTISWGSVQTIDVSITSKFAGHCIAIARTDNGRLVVAYTEDYTTMGKDYRQTKLIGSDGDGAAPTWSGEITWNDPSGNTNNKDKDRVWFGLENFGSTQGDRVLLYASVPDAGSTGGYKVSTAVPDWAGSSFSNTTANDVETTLSNIQLGTNISAVIAADDKAHFIYTGNGNQFDILSRKAATAGDDDWGSALTVNDSSIDGYTDALTLALDTGPATDELCVFYHQSADSTDFHYKKTPIDTISWGSEQTITFASDLIALTSWNRDIESGLHIGIQDADTDVWYHEFDVSNGEPPPAGQPVMKRMQGVPTMPGSRDRIGGWN